MPLYEYLCNACEQSFETIRKFSDPPLTECAICGADDQLKKLLSPPAIQFKGSGWYITDYARKQNTGKADEQSTKKATDSADSGKDAKSGTAKNDSKKDGKSKSDNKKPSDGKAA